MKLAGPARADYNPDARALVKLVAEFARRGGSALTVEKPGFRLQIGA